MINEEPDPILQKLLEENKKKKQQGRIATAASSKLEEIVRDDPVFKKLVIDHSALRKALAYSSILRQLMGGRGHECLGYLVAPKEETNFRVHDVILLEKQDVSSIGAEGRKAHLATLDKLNDKGLKMLGIWHSHADCGFTSHSSIDDSYMSAVSSPEEISCRINMGELPFEKKQVGDKIVLSVKNPERESSIISLNLDASDTIIKVNHEFISSINFWYGLIVDNRRDYSAEIYYSFWEPLSKTYEKVYHHKIVVAGDIPFSKSVDCTEANLAKELMEGVILEGKRLLGEENDVKRIFRQIEPELRKKRIRNETIEKIIEAKRRLPVVIEPLADAEEEGKTSAALHGQTTELNRNYSAAQTKVAELTSKLNDTLTERDKYKSESEQALRTLQEQLTNVSNELNAKKAELATVQRKHAELNNKYSAEQETAARLTSELNAANSEKQTLEQNLTDTKTKATTLQQKYDSLKAAEESKDGRVAELVRQLDGARTDSRNQLEANQAEIQSKDEQINQITGRYTAEQNNVAELTSKLDAAITEKDKYTSEAEQTKLKIEAKLALAITERDSYKTKAEQTSAGLQAASSKISELESQLDEVKTELSSKTSEFNSTQEEYNQSIREAEQKLDLINEQLTNVSNELNARKAELASAQRNHDELNSKYSAEQQTTVELKAALSTVNSEKQTLEQRAVTAETKAAASQQQYNDLKAAEESKDGRVAELVRQLEGIRTDSRTQLEANQAEIQSKDEQINQITGRYTAEQNNVAELTSKLDAAITEKNNYKTQAEQAKQEHESKLVLAITEKNSYKTKAERTSAELHTANSKISGLESQLTAARTELDNKTAEYTSKEEAQNRCYEQLRVESEQALRTSQEQLTIVSNELNAKKAELASAQRSYDELNNKYSAEQQTTVELKAALSTVNSEKQTLEQRAVTAETKATELQHEYNKLRTAKETEGTEKDSMIEQLQTALRDSNERYDKISQKITALEAESMRYQQIHETAIRALRTELEQLHVGYGKAAVVELDKELARNKKLTMELEKTKSDAAENQKKLDAVSNFYYNALKPIFEPAVRIEVEPTDGFKKEIDTWFEGAMAVYSSIERKIEAFSIEV